MGPGRWQHVVDKIAHKALAGHLDTAANRVFSVLGVVRDEIYERGKPASIFADFFSRDIIDFMFTNICLGIANSIVVVGLNGFG